MIALSNYFRRLVSYPQTPESKRAVYQFFGWTLALSWLLSVSVPDRILSNHEWARAFCDFMASFIPQIDRVTIARPTGRMFDDTDSLLSENNRFYFSVMWAVSPIYIVWVWVGMTMMKRYSVELVQLTFIRFLGLLVLMVVALLMFFVMPLGPHLKRFTLGVPFFRGFTAPFLVLGPAVIFTMFVYALKEGLLEEIKNWRSNWRNPHG